MNCYSKISFTFLMILIVATYGCEDRKPDVTVTKMMTSEQLTDHGEAGSSLEYNMVSEIQKDNVVLNQYVEHSGEIEKDFNFTKQIREETNTVWGNRKHISKEEIDYKNYQISQNEIYSGPNDNLEFSVQKDYLKPKTVKDLVDIDKNAQP